MKQSLFGFGAFLFEEIDRTKLNSMTKWKAGVVQYAEKVQYVRSFGKVSKKLEGDMTLHETMDIIMFGPWISSCLGHGCSLN